MCVGGRVDTQNSDKKMMKTKILVRRRTDIGVTLAKMIKKRTPKNLEKNDQNENFGGAVRR